MQPYIPHSRYIFRYILNQTNLAVSSHCRWWSPKTPMAKANGGKYDFIIEENMALPIDDNLFYDLMADARSWGTIQFNQDWLAQMWEKLDILKTDVTVG